MSTATEYLPNFYPPVHDQWVMIDGHWDSEANNCVAMTLSTIKSIHHYRRYNEEAIFSTKWIFGNRHSSDTWGDDGMLYSPALDKLKADGVPEVDELDNMFYEDFYKDGVMYEGAKRYAANNRAALLPLAQRNRIGNHQKYDTYLGITSSMLSTIKQSIIDNGAAMLTLNLYDEFYDVPSNGIVPDYNGGSSNYALAVSANVSHGAMGSSVSVPTDPVDPPPTLPSTPGYYGPEYGAGHSMAILGWTRIGGYNYWICQNSWGDWWGWGQGGRCFIRMTNPAIWSVYTMTDGPKYPQRLRGLSGLASTTDTSRIHLTWTASAYATSYRINYRVKGQADWIDAGGAATNDYVVTGLVAGTYYEFKVYAQNANGNGESAELTGDKAISTKANRPDNWQWHTAKVANQPINLTAAEWNAFLQRIERFRLYNAVNSPKPIYLQATAGQVITAAIVNSARSAIITTGGAPPIAVITGQTAITAKFFNDLRNAINNIP